MKGRPKLVWNNHEEERKLFLNVVKAMYEACKYTNAHVFATETAILNVGNFEMIVKGETIESAFHFYINCGDDEIVSASTLKECCCKFIKKEKERIELIKRLEAIERRNL